MRERERSIFTKQEKKERLRLVFGVRRRRRRGAFHSIRLFVLELQLSENLFIGWFGDVSGEIGEEFLNQLFIRSEMSQLIRFVHFQFSQLVGQELQQIFVFQFDFVRQALRILADVDLLFQLVDRLSRRRREKQRKKMNTFTEKNTRLPFEVVQGDSTI